jgi:hypothetical protein
MEWDRAFEKVYDERAALADWARGCKLIEEPGSEELRNSRLAEV